MTTSSRMLGTAPALGLVPDSALYTVICMALICNRCVVLIICISSGPHRCHAC